MLPTQENFQFDLEARCREAVRLAIQVALDDELVEALAEAGADGGPRALRPRPEHRALRR
ncbi:MAG: hypothetical protein HS111_11925 [Kofleriaceae bacterium]|nr:hypothetical protein [Kofleriaceae bacterium]MCL4227276.1 hypothetical protein [Myxococcales bacterium]